MKVFFNFSLALCVLATPQIARAEGGKLIGTGGVTAIEGSGGGGLATWGLVTGSDTRDTTGVNASYTHVQLTDYTLDSSGVSVGIKDRVELSYAHQSLGISNGVTSPIAAGLGLPTGALSGTRIDEDTFGAKVKLFGEAVFSSKNSLLPQTSIGVQYKVNDSFDVIPKTLGAKHDTGADYYLAATKVFLGGLGGYNLVLNGTVRETKANAIGLLGFGGDKNDSYQPEFEGSAAVFLNRQTAFGVEYRTTPDNLSATKSDAYKDAFVAFFPSKSISVTAAYLDLGNLPGGFSAAGVTKENASGLYLSTQFSVP